MRRTDGGASPPPWGSDFEQFVAQRAPALLRTAVFLTGDRHAAEDLLQTALVRTALRWRHAQDNPDAYIRQVLVNLTRDTWRTSLRRVREVPLDAAADDRDHAVLAHRPSGGVSPESALADRDLLLTALRQLPTRQRTAVVLRYWEDMSVAETAASMRCSEGTVKSATSRGLRALKALLSNENGPREPGRPTAVARRR